MRVLEINSGCGVGSTGRIATDIAQYYIKKGHECKIAYGRGKVPEYCRDYAIRIGGKLNVYKHVLVTRLLDQHGFASKTDTKCFLKWADEYNPDLLWLHNIHGYYINVEELFKWIKSRPDMEVRWTLHDCWAFTGHCGFFTLAKCNKWKTHCLHCTQYHKYPGSFFIDNSNENFERKKRAFKGVKNMTLITPSQWLADLVSESYLKEYPVEVHHNTIDTNIFKPTPSDFRKRYGIENRKMLLGVASPWSERKGLKDFVKLAQMLNDEYVIVLVGLSKKQIKALPKQIIGLRKVDNPKELATIYTTADLFVNPSREETFGMTTMEAQACGTDAIVYEGTACEEVVKTYGGLAIPPGVDNLYRAITGKEYFERGGQLKVTIICIGRTDSSSELAKIYTAADIFVNPTYEDNFPTVNLEARACGTYVITYNSGGSAETLYSELL